MTAIEMTDTRDLMKKWQIFLFDEEMTDVEMYDRCKRFDEEMTFIRYLIKKWQMKKCQMGDVDDMDFLFLFDDPNGYNHSKS